MTASPKKGKTKPKGAFPERSTDEIPRNLALRRFITLLGREPIEGHCTPRRKRPPGCPFSVGMEDVRERVGATQGSRPLRATCCGPIETLANPKPSRSRISGISFCGPSRWEWSFNLLEARDGNQFGGGLRRRWPKKHASALLVVADTIYISTTTTAKRLVDSRRSEPPCQ